MYRMQRTQLLQLWQATDWNKCDSWHLCLDPADKILTYTVLKWWLLQQGDTATNLGFYN